MFGWIKQSCEMLPPVIGRIVGVIGEGIMDTFWPQIDSKFNEIQKDFEDHENQIRIFAQQFRGVRFQINFSKLFKYKSFLAYSKNSKYVQFRSKNFERYY